MSALTISIAGSFARLARPRTQLMVIALVSLSGQPLRQRMSEAALRRVAEIGGWDAYGARWAARLSNGVQ